MGAIIALNDQVLRVRSGSEVPFQTTRASKAGPQSPEYNSGATEVFMSKDATSYQIQLESEKVQFLEKAAERHGLPDIGKAIRCLINYARENPDREAEIFGELRCLDC